MFCEYTADKSTYSMQGDRIPVFFSMEGACHYGLPSVLRKRFDDDVLRCMMECCYRCKMDASPGGLRSNVNQEIQDGKVVSRRTSSCVNPHPHSTNVKETGKRIWSLESLRWIERSLSVPHAIV